MVRCPCSQHVEFLTQAPGHGEEQGHRSAGGAQHGAPAAAARLRPAPPQEELIREFVPHSQVTAFVWSVVRHVVPVVCPASTWSTNTLMKTCINAAASDSQCARHWHFKPVPVSRPMAQAGWCVQGGA